MKVHIKMSSSAQRVDSIKKDTEVKKFLGVVRA